MDVDADSSVNSEVGVDKEAKLIVYKSKLMELLDSSPLCQGFCAVTVAHSKGTFWKFKVKCNRCDYGRSWSAQPFVSFSESLD